VADFVIDNPGTEIYLSGGYKNLCLKEVYEKMLKPIEDIIEDTGAKIVCYPPLMIEDRFNSNLDSKEYSFSKKKK
jgi:hypothetical protein